VATVARLRTLTPVLIVMEATGGYERALVAALATVGLPLVVANPRQVRDFAKATGQLAKTDRLDADLLALFAERVRPTPRPLTEPVLQQLDALLTRRRQLLDMLTAERNRLEHAEVSVRRSLTDHIRWLERQVADVDRDLDRTIEQSPVWRARESAPQCAGRRSRREPYAARRGSGARLPEPQADRGARRGRPARARQWHASRQAARVGYADRHDLAED
jgi:transposase